MTTATKSRREKVKAMAEQTASPEEAKVAAAMLATMKVEPLDRIADDIRAEWGKGIESQFAIGRLLNEAAAFLASSAYPPVGEYGRRGDEAYSRWRAEQQFQFGRGTAHLLRVGAQNEDKVRAFIEGRVQGHERDLGVPWAVQLLTAKTPAERAAKAHPGYADPEAAPQGEAVDPSFAALRSATRLILGWQPDGEGGGEYTANAFKSMHVDDLAASAGFIKALADGYTEAKKARVAG